MYGKIPQFFFLGLIFDLLSFFPISISPNFLYRLCVCINFDTLRLFKVEYSFLFPCMSKSRGKPLTFWFLDDVQRESRQDWFGRISHFLVLRPNPLIFNISADSASSTVPYHQLLSLFLRSFAWEKLSFIKIKPHWGNVPVSSLEENMAKFLAWWEDTFGSWLLCLINFENFENQVT